MRASGAPMQKWMPAPKLTFWPSVRNGSKRLASAKARWVAIGRAQHQADDLALLEAQAVIERRRPAGRSG
jgi:hypothetical protein